MKRRKEGMRKARTSQSKRQRAAIATSSNCCHTAGGWAGGGNG